MVAFVTIRSHALGWREEKGREGEDCHVYRSSLRSGSDIHCNCCTTEDAEEEEGREKKVLFGIPFRILGGRQCLEGEIGEGNATSSWRNFLNASRTQEKEKGGGGRKGSPFTLFDPSC